MKNRILLFGLLAIFLASAVSAAGGITVNLETSPANNSWTNDNTPQFFFNATKDNTTTLNCRLWINSSGSDTQFGNATISNSSSSNITANASISDESTLECWIECVDETNGNFTNSSILVINVDTAPPSSITMSSPTHGKVLSNTSAIFGWTVVDATDPTLTCNVTVGDQYTGSYSIASTNNTATTKTVTIDESTRTWQVVCWDSAGNVQNSTIFKYSVTVSSDGLAQQVCSGPNGVQRWNPYLNNNLGGCCAVNEIYNPAYALPQYNWGCMPVAGVSTPSAPAAVIPGTSTSIPDIQIPEDMDPELLVLGVILSFLIAAYMLTKDN